ncbi:unnamed protein product [Lupinus luteus]|uniref:RNase H type-1 domain-containing protein n=1 Tax=Lupinus luteus TaxID=3873 RepID=A0AAV1VQH2_LUPLU
MASPDTQNSYDSSTGIPEWVTKFGKSSEFLIALWFIWTRRNALVMANEDWVQYKVMVYIPQIVTDVRKFNAASHHHLTKVPKIVNWCLSLPRQVKLNINGNSLGNLRRTGCGGLIRCDKGNWITGFSRYVDSLQAISLVTHDIPQYHIYATIATAIQDLLRRTWSVYLAHSVHETNYPTDFLAKLGARENVE